MESKAIEVIRHSLAAANAALDLLEPTRVTGDTCGLQQAVEVQTAPAVVNSCFEEAVPDFVDNSVEYERIMAQLNGPFKLRTVSELTAVLGFGISKIKDRLEEYGTYYVIKNRCSDNAPLIGLLSRN